MGCGSSNAVATVKAGGTDLNALQKKYPVLSHKSMKILYDCFMKICPNGKMRKPEFQSFYLHFNDTPDNAPLAEFSGNLFLAFDDDRSGTMEIDEFISMIAVVIGGTLIDRLMAVFNLCDLDKSGTIERHELIQTLKTLSMLSPDNRAEKEKEFTELAEKIFDAIDADGDGNMTLTEFLDGFQNREEGKTLADLIFSTMRIVLLGQVKD